jgi:hypothetical protein
MSNFASLNCFDFLFKSHLPTKALLRVMIAPHTPLKMAVSVKALRGKGQIIAQVATLNLLGASAYAESEGVKSPPP